VVGIYAGTCESSSGGEMFFERFFLARADVDDGTDADEGGAEGTEL
jgi:hypothetical protein